MDLYRTWAYTGLLNTTWFIYSVFVIVMLLNVTAPIWLWRLFAGKSILPKRNKKRLTN